MTTRILLGAAVLFGGLLSERVGRGERTHEVRTGPDDSYVVFVPDAVDDTGGKAWLGRKGGAAAAVALPRNRWILDVLIDDEQRLWVALGDIPRTSPIRLLRYDGQQSAEFEVKDTHSA